MGKRTEILLVQLPPWDPDTVPLGVACLATFLKSKNISVEVLDLNIHMYNARTQADNKGWEWMDNDWWRSNKAKENFLPQFEEFADIVLEFDTQVIGFSVNRNSVVFLNCLLECIKRKCQEKKIIVGGPAVFFQHDRISDFETKLIDYFVVGDGESALYKLLCCLREENSFNADKYKSCKSWKDSPQSKPICLQEKVMDLDMIGYPIFEEFDISAYKCEGSILPIIFSKGCSRHCTFCADTVISHPLRFRSPEKVVDQIKYYLKQFPKLKSLRINDLSFNADLEFLDEFSQRIIDEGICISWQGGAQVRPDMKHDLLVKMKKAGCQAMELGLENFSDNVLSLMKKQYTGAQAVSFLKALKAVGIRTEILFIVGFPGETRDDFYLNIDFIKRNASYIDRFCSVDICGFPRGCELFADQERFGYFYNEGGDWQTYDGNNNWQERKWRFNELVSCIKQAGIPFDLSIDVDLHEEILNDKSIKLIS